MTMGIKSMLSALNEYAWRHRVDQKVHMFARKAADEGTDHGDKVRLIIEKLHRRFVYAPDPVKEGITSLEDGHGDVEDFCWFTAACAMSIGIPCRIVGARYNKRCWTCFVAYQDEKGYWTGVDPLQQKTDHIEFEELAWS